VSSMGPLIAQATPALVSLFLSLVPVLEQLVAGFPAFVTALMPLIPIMGEIAGLVAEAAVALFPIFLTVLQALLPIFQGLTAALRDNAGLIAIVVGGFAALIGIGTIISKIITFVSAFKVVIGAVIGLFKSLGVIVTIAKAAFALFNLVLMANPLFLIVGAVAALVAGLGIFFTTTERGKEVWASFVEFFQTLIRGMVVGFQMLVADLKEMWSAVTEFFTNGWDIFTEYFFTALTAIGDFFKGIINGWISLFEGFINFVIGGVNNLINALNKIQLDVPATPFNDAFTFGVNIPNIPEVSLPRLAKGGIVDRTTIAMIGEAGPEAVIPLDKLDQMGGGGPTYNITVQAGVGDPVRIGEEVVTAIKRYERVSGPVFASA